MKIANFISVLLLSSAIVGCTENKKSTLNLLSVDVNANYPKKELILQDFMDIIYVPLECSDEFLTQGVVRASGNNILLITNWVNDGDIFVFDWTGKGLRKINRLGQSGEEYAHITNIVLDEDNNEMYIVDYPARKIFAYDLFGNFHRSFDFEDTSFYENISNYDQENLICYKGYSPLIEKEESSHLLISKKDGSVNKRIKLPYKEIETPVWSKEGAVVTPSFYLTTPCQDDLLVMRPSSDTIYKYLSNGSLEPFIVRSPSINSMDPEIFFFPTAITDRYYFMRTFSKEFDIAKRKGFPFTDLVYDKQENAIFQSFVYNNDYSNKEQFIMSHPAEETVGHKIVTCEVLNSAQLIEAHEKGILRGRLNEIASRLDEESNPVIMIVKHKQ